MYDLLRTSGRIVSFSTKPVSILPRTYTNVEVTGVVGYTIAIGIEDITAKYQQIIPYIEGINTDFSKAEYVIIRHSDSNALEVLALAWIDEETIQTTSLVNRTIHLYNVDSAVDARLVKMLRRNGFTQFNIVNS